MASMYLVHFLLNPLPALCAPVTELAVLSPKQAFNTSAVVRVLDRAMICLNGIDERESARVAYGKALGEPVVYVVVAGWPSVEAHIRAVESDPALPKIAADLKDLAHWSLIHVALTEDLEGEEDRIQNRG